MIKKITFTKVALYSVLIITLAGLTFFISSNRKASACYCDGSSSCTIGGSCTACSPNAGACGQGHSGCADGNGVDNGKGGCHCDTSGDSCGGGGGCSDAAPSPSPFSIVGPGPACTVVNPATSAVTLTWNGISGWGKNCGTQTNTYKVYVDGTNNPPAAGALVGSVASNVTTFGHTGWVRGHRYYWRVEASNGALSSWSNVGCFDITPAPTSNLTVAPATASSTLIPQGTAAGTGGLLYSSVVGDQLKMSLNGSQANSFLNSITLYDRTINPTGVWSAGGLFTAPCSGVTPCATISNNTYNWTVKPGTWQLVVNAFNNNSGDGGRCTGNPDPASFPFVSGGFTWYDCSNTADGQRDIITINAIPLRSVNGTLYRETVMGVCKNDPLSDDIDNSAIVDLRYDFNGSTNLLKTTNVTLPNPSYNFSIPDGAVLKSLCVRNLVPANGDYTISCVAGGSYPTGTMCYSFPGTGTAVNGSNVTTNLGFFKHTQTAWYTLLDSDVYTYDAINQSIPSGVAPFSGVLVDNESSSQKGYALSSSSTISSGSGTSGIYVTNHGGYAAGLGPNSKFYYLTDTVTAADVNSYPSVSNFGNVSTFGNKLFKSTLNSIGNTVYNVSYADSFPGDTALIYVTPSGGTLSITGTINPLTPTSGRLLFYVIGSGVELGTTSTPIPGQSMLPAAVNSFAGISNDINAAFISQGGITVQGSGASSTNDDNTLVVKGILAGQSVGIRRTRGFINNETRPALISRYDSRYLYDLTKDLRDGSVSQLPGLSVTDITWNED